MVQHRQLFLGFLSLVTLHCNQPVEFSGSNQSIKQISVVTSEKFAASTLKHGSLGYNFQYKSLSELITLKAREPQTARLNQISRPRTTATYIQGYQGDMVREQFSIKTPDKLDLLLVIDNSSSMADYQKRLATGLLPLLSHIGNTDWQMMVITTSPIRKSTPNGIVKIFGCPRLNKYDPEDGALITKGQFEKDSALAVKRFEWKVSVGETGDPIERGLLAAVEGLKGECGDSSKSWIRPDAHKAVLLLTDEENCGSDPDQNCDGSPDSSPDYFTRLAPKGTQFFALLHDKDRYADTCDDVGYIRKPMDYRAVIAATGGIEGNICALSYEATLGEISKNIHPINKIVYQLKPTGDRSDIQISINGLPQNMPFEINNDELLFKSPLPQDAETLTVSYRTGVIPRFHALDLAPRFDPTSLVVRVNGQAIAEKEYQLLEKGTLSSEPNKIVFATPPPDLATVEISALDRSVPLPKNFALGQSLPQALNPETLVVKVNSQEDQTFQFDPIGHTLSFPSPPKDGSLIEIDYETADSRQTVYPITVLGQGESIQSVTIQDAATLASIDGHIEKDHMVIDPHEVKANRKVIVSYSVYDALETFQMTLPHKPLLGSVTLSGQASDCLNLHQLSNRTIFFPCPNREIGDLKIDYQYWDAINTEYPIPTALTPKQKLKVLLDGKTTTAYEVRGNKIYLDPRILSENVSIEIIVESSISN